MVGSRFTKAAKEGKTFNLETKDGTQKIDLWNKKTGDMESTFGVLQNVSKHWDNMTSAQKRAFAIQYAGVNQSEVLLSVLNNFSHAQQAATTALNSNGSATRENAAYMDSLQAKLTIVRKELKDMANDFLNSDVFKGVLDGFITVLKFINSDIGHVTLGITAFGLAFNKMLSPIKRATAAIKAYRAAKIAAAEAEVGAQTITAGIPMPKMNKELASAGKGAGAGMAEATANASKLSRVLAGLTSPMGLFLLGTTAVVAGSYAIYKNFTSIDAQIERSQKKTDALTKNIESNKQKQIDLKDKIVKLEGKDNLTDPEKVRLQVMKDQLEILKQQTAEKEKQKRAQEANTAEKKAEKATNAYTGKTKVKDGSALGYHYRNTSGQEAIRNDAAKVEATSKSVTKNIAAWKKATKSVDSYKKQIGDVNKATDKQKQHLAKLEKAQNGYGKAVTRDVDGLKSTYKHMSKVASSYNSVIKHGGKLSATQKATYKDITRSALAMNKAGIAVDYLDENMVKHIKTLPEARKANGELSESAKDLIKQWGRQTGETKKAEKYIKSFNKTKVSPKKLQAKDETKKATSSAKKNVKSVKGKSVNVKAQDRTGAASASAHKRVNKIRQNRPISIKAQNNTGGAIASVRSALASLRDKVVNIFVNKHSSGGKAGKGMATGGEATGGATLVGERGAEMVSSNGRAYLVGVGGAEIVNLKKGDMVFTAQETKRMLHGKNSRKSFPAREGGTPGRGKTTFDFIGKYIATSIADSIRKNIDVVGKSITTLTAAIVKGAQYGGTGVTKTSKLKSISNIDKFKSGALDAYQRQDLSIDEYYSMSESKANSYRNNEKKLKKEEDKYNKTLKKIKKKKSKKKISKLKSKWKKTQKKYKNKTLSADEYADMMSEIAKNALDEQRKRYEDGTIDADAYYKVMTQKATAYYKAGKITYDEYRSYMESAQEEMIEDSKNKMDNLIKDNTAMLQKGSMTVGQFAQSNIQAINDAQKKGVLSATDASDEIATIWETAFSEMSNQYSYGAISAQQYADSVLSYANQAYKAGQITYEAFRDQQRNAYDALKTVLEDYTTEQTQAFKKGAIGLSEFSNNLIGKIQDNVNKGIMTSKEGAEKMSEVWSAVFDELSSKLNYGMITAQQYSEQLIETATDAYQKGQIDWNTFREQIHTAKDAEVNAEQEALSAKLEALQFYAQQRQEEAQKEEAQNEKIKVFEDGQWRYVNDPRKSAEASQWNDKLNAIERQVQRAEIEAKLNWKTIEDIIFMGQEQTLDNFSKEYIAASIENIAIAKRANEEANKILKDVGGYATGTTSIAKNGVYRFNENGRELMIPHNLNYANRGDGVIPHNLTENLIELGQYTPKDFLNNQSKNNIDSHDVHIDSVTVKANNPQDFIKQMRNLVNVNV